MGEPLSIWMVWQRCGKAREGRGMEDPVASGNNPGFGLVYERLCFDQTSAFCAFILLRFHLFGRIIVLARLKDVHGKSTYNFELSLSQYTKGRSMAQRQGKEPQKASRTGIFVFNVLTIGATNKP